MEEEITLNLGLARYLHSLVCEHPDFEVLCQPTLDLCCFRYMPNALADRMDQHQVHQRLDQLNREIVESLHREGFVLVTSAEVDGRVAIRISIRQRTMRGEIDATFEAIARYGGLFTKEQLSVIER